MPDHITFARQPSDLPCRQAIIDGARNINGIYAISTEINEQWLNQAYQNGLFPWYNEGQPIMWHCPEPRMILPLHHFRISRSLQKCIKKWVQQPKLGMHVTINHNFEQVISSCAITARHQQNGTWITDELRSAYTNLHYKNHALSVELWQKDILIAGLYGVIFGKMFFGESMFTRITDGSKVALACLVHYLRQQDFKIIDCQQNTQHLRNMGGHTISRNEFLNQSAALMQLPALNFASLSAQTNLLDFFIKAHE